MKQDITLIVFAALALLAGCERADVDNVGGIESRKGQTFTAGFEKVDTRTYVDSNLRLYWNADDRLSIFATTYNQQSSFAGQTGDTEGPFEPVGSIHIGNTVLNNYAVYPYNSATSLTGDERIKLILPSVQPYAPNTFGVGANTMVAVTDGINDYFLPFRNVCGYLVVKLYGDATVKAVTFEGNNGEKIAGAATVTASHAAAPTIVMSEEATTTITIDCGEGIQLGRTAETATEFWFVIPPTTFSNGFTIKAVGEGVMQMKKSTTASRTIQRNVVNTMPALEAVFDSQLVEFEDAKFKAYCVSKFDKDGDGEISYPEALLITRVSIGSKGIESLKGIEAFTNLEELICPGNPLKSIDISHNTALKALACYDNQLTSLDVTHNTALTDLRCFKNKLINLDVSHNAALTKMWCDQNQLTSLDISHNMTLSDFRCNQNQLTSLDVSHNTELTVLWCQENQLTSLDVSNNTELRTLYCFLNQLITLDISNNPRCTAKRIY